jgi:hypothetical protein
MKPKHESAAPASNQTPACRNFREPHRTHGVCSELRGSGHGVPLILQNGIVDHAYGKDPGNFAVESIELPTKSLLAMGWRISQLPDAVGWPVRNTPETISMYRITCTNRQKPACRVSCRSFWNNPNRLRTQKGMEKFDESLGRKDEHWTAIDVRAAVQVDIRREPRYVESSKQSSRFCCNGSVRHQVLSGAIPFFHWPGQCARVPSRPRIWPQGGQCVMA